MSLEQLISRWPELRGHPLSESAGARLGDGALGVTLADRFIKIYPIEALADRQKHAALLADLATAKVHPLTPVPSESGNVIEYDDHHCIEVTILHATPRPFYNDYLAADGIADILSALNRVDVQSVCHRFTQHSHTMFDDALAALRRLSPTGRADIVHVLERTVYTGLAPYLPFMERRLAHGDLHPGNLFVSPAHTIVAADWEFARIDVELFDLAFLLGCVGIDDPELLTGNWVRRLLTSCARQMRITPLGRDRLYDLMVATRIPWLVTWFSKNDSEMIDLECDFIRTLIAHRSWIVNQWHEWLPIRKIDAEKWVIADAVFDDNAKRLKSEIDEEEISTTAPLLQHYTPEEIAPALRQLIIAYGKEHDIRRVLDMVQMQEELFERTAMNDDLLPDLAYTYANASLDCARIGQLAAIRELDDRIAKLHAAVPENFDVVCAQAFILRNMSILLDDRGLHDEAEQIIAFLETLYVASDSAMPIAGELARALSSRVISLLKLKNEPAAAALTDAIANLVGDWPDYYKTTTALAFAQKNLVAFRSRSTCTTDKQFRNNEITD